MESQIKLSQLNSRLMETPTGDPFVDTGGFVWANMELRNPSYTPIKLIEEVARIFIYSWDQKVHSFFANSNITHNSYSGKKEKSLQDVLKYFKDLMDERPELVVTKNGYCRLTGANTTLFSVDRRNLVLVGSGGLANFDHGLQGGYLVCKEVIIRSFVMPLGAMQVGANPSIIISNNYELTAKFVNDNVKSHLNAIAFGQAGLHKAAAGNTTNALFGFAERCVSDIKEADEKNTTLNLYHFSNFVNGPGFQQNTLPDLIFKFYTSCLRKFPNEWSLFVKSHYNKKASEKASKKAKGEEGSETQVLESFFNPLLSKLLKTESISKLALNWLLKGNYLPFKIIISYQTHLRKMDKRSISSLQKIAYFVVNDRHNDAIEKIIKQLNSAKSQRVVRSALLKLVAENYELEDSEPLIYLSETEYLFPENYSWVEMRDLLLIGIYEELHKANKKVKVDLPEEGDDNAES